MRVPAPRCQRDPSEAVTGRRHSRSRWGGDPGEGRRPHSLSRGGSCSGGVIPANFPQRSSFLGLGLGVGCVGWVGGLSGRGSGRVA